ncbi:MAG TPA: trehalose-6-phosphate synthase [Candidatus Omnitrophota bacterium]|nr:trehalose-6-phosphate synthase [Candidatus Omnitrophota bacterium]
MRRVLLFVLPILIIVTLVFMMFGAIQVKSEEAKLLDELARKAKAVAESMELSVKHILENNDSKGAVRQVEKFQKRERLQGCILYDKERKILAITERFSEWKDKDKPYVKEVMDNKIARGGVEKFKENTVYSYVLPIMGDNEDVIGAVELIYDTAYVFMQLTELWKRLSMALVILVLLIVVISVIVQRRIFTEPVERLTEWFTKFQKGEIDAKHPIKEKGELGKLASEVEQVALNIRIARKAASDEATKRILNEDFWTEEKLKDVVRSKLGENSLFVISNREPYIHILDEKTKTPRCVRPASGVVTALDPVLRACGGTWIAHGSGDTDKKFVNSKNKLGVPPGDDRYILKRVWLTKDEEEGYYYGFSNEGLWPLCHNTHTRPVFREADWEQYKKANEKFCQSIIDELPTKKPYVFIQDYHFSILPKMIKDKRPDTTIALFWHIPWPNPEIFSTCPYHKEILEGMLGCDLLGFHVQYHCNNFLDTVNRLLECRVDAEKFSIVRSGRETKVKAFPISVDIVDHGDQSVIIEEKGKISREFDLADKIVGVGVERIDYTKGIAERMYAIDRFLEKNPQYKNKFVFIQLAAPSRTHIKRYHDLMGEIDEVIEKINWKHMDGNWKPIIYLKRHFSPEEIKPFFNIADLCIVSSLHDGMNLVAKEYIAAKTDCCGSLVLSQFTGAARELTDAILINPYAVEEFADSIRMAVEMPLVEKKKRMENMRKIVFENNVFNWAGSIVTDLASLGRS